MPTLLPRFAIHQPESLKEASEMLQEYGDEGHAYAGGTELLLAMKQGGLRFGHLVDLKTVPGLTNITNSDGGVRIGALVTHLSLERSDLIRERLPIFTEVERQVANVRVRASGTIGGNLCFGEPHSDPATLLLCLDCRMHVVGAAGERDITLLDFAVGPYETALEEGEILTGLSVSALRPSQRAAYQKFQVREYPMLGLALILDLDLEKQCISEAQLAIGSASPTPRRSATAEAGMTGEIGKVRESLDVTADLLADDAELMDDLDGSAEYKRHLIHVFLKRMFARVLNGESA